MSDPYIDFHCHLYKYGAREISNFIERYRIKIVGVSDDYRSSIEMLKLAESNRGHIVPCVGVHPWTVSEIENYREEIDSVLRILNDNPGIKCIGEVGLDKKFVPADAYGRLLESFKIFVSYASERNMVLNIHAAGAWREAFEVVNNSGVDKAIFHWYTGPLDLLKDLCSAGYYITINPAVKIQNKHRIVAENVDLKCMLVESDGPYKYRGLNLDPPMIIETIEYISNLRSIEPKDIVSSITSSFRHLFQA